MDVYPLAKQRTSDVMFFLFLLIVAEAFACFVTFFVRKKTFSAQNAIKKFIILGFIFAFAVVSLLIAILDERSVRKFQKGAKEKFVASISTRSGNFWKNDRSRYVDSDDSSAKNGSNEKDTDSHPDTKDSQKAYASALKRDVFRKTMWICICSVILVASTTGLALALFSKRSLIFGKSYSHWTDLVHHLDVMISMCIIAFAFVASVIALAALVHGIESKAYQQSKLLVGAVSELSAPAKCITPEPVAGRAVQKKQYGNLQKVLLLYIMQFPECDITKDTRPPINKGKRVFACGNKGTRVFNVVPKKSHGHGLLVVLPFLLSVIAIVVPGIFKAASNGPSFPAVKLGGYVIAAALFLIGVILVFASAINSSRSIRRSSDIIQKFKNDTVRMKIASYLNKVFENERDGDDHFLNWIKEGGREDDDYFLNWIRFNIFGQDVATDMKDDSVLTSYFTKGESSQITLIKYVIKDNNMIELHFDHLGTPHTADMDLGIFILNLLGRFSEEFTKDNACCECIGSESQRQVINIFAHNFITKCSIATETTIECQQLHFLANCHTWDAQSANRVIEPEFSSRHSTLADGRNAISLAGELAHAEAKRMSQSEHVSDRSDYESGRYKGMKPEIGKPSGSPGDTYSTQFGEEKGSGCSENNDPTMRASTPNKTMHGSSSAALTHSSERE